MRRVAQLCSVFPEQALVARRLLERQAKGAESKVRKGHEFDAAPLLAYLHPVCGVPEDPALCEISQFTHGQSNPTFTVRWDGGAVVVRKQPKGTLLRGAHDVGREHAFAVHLRPLGVAAPRARAYCEDTQVLGTEFWVYDYAEGRHFRDPYLEKAEASERPAIFRSAVDVLATLHGAAPPEALVERLGGAPKAGYLGRQVKTWTRQFAAADEKLGEATDPAVLDHAAALRAACEAHGGAVDETSLAPGEFFVAHGDFRTDNMIFATDSADVVALLDWELAALGHPVGDLAYICMPYAIPPLLAGPLTGFLGLDRRKHGVPDLAHLVGTYATVAQRQGPRAKILETLTRQALPHFDLFTAVSYFRIAAIVRGVYSRAKAGTASAANADAVGALADTLLDVSLDAAKKHAAVVAGTAPPLTWDDALAAAPPAAAAAR